MSLYKYLKNLSSNGYPILDNAKYENLVSNYAKEDLINSISDIICENRNKPLPFPEISIQQVEELFECLLDKKENLITDNDKNIWTKHTYEFDKKRYFGTIQLGHHYNSISNFFHRHNRYKCGGYNRVSPCEIWNGIGMKDGEWKSKLKGFLSPLFRSVNNFRKIEQNEYMFCFRLSSTVYTAPQFRPNVAKIIYENFSKNGNIIDFSAGWGDRLAGFFSSKNTKKYLATDPNLDLHQDYKKQIQTYSKYCKKECVINNLPAEDLDWNEYSDDYDLIFTSPPYFSTEKYAKDCDFEEFQSWSRYQDKNSWLEYFLFNVIEKTSKLLQKNGKLIINIFDIEMKKNQREEICKPMIDFCEQIGYQYDGYIGMRIKQRPKNFNNPLLKKEYMSSYYVEPMWIFTKK